MRKFYVIIFAILFGSSLWAAKPDSVKFHIYAWQLDEFNDRVEYQIDTVIDRIQLLYPFYQNQSFSNTFLGHNGLPVKSNIFSLQPLKKDFLVLNYLDPYINNSSKTIYYNTTSPFTRFDYSSGKKNPIEDNYLNITHTQNIGKDFNFGFNYKIISYQNGIARNITQKAKDQSASFFTSYISDIYCNHFSFNYNRLELNENGGVVDDNLVGKVDPFPFRAFANVASKNRIISASMIHGINLHKLFIEDDDSIKKYNKGISLYHKVEVELNKRNYTDLERDTFLYQREYFPAGKFPASQFNNLASNDTTLIHNDSIINNKITNSLFIELPNRISGIPLLKLMVFSEYNNFKFIMPPLASFNSGKNGNTAFDDTIYNYNPSSVKNSYGIGLFLKEDINNRLTLNVSSKLYSIGYKKGDYNVNVDLRLNFQKESQSAYFISKLNINNSSPTYFDNNYASTYYLWQQDLKKNKIQFLSGAFVFPTFRLKLNASIQNMVNYIYYNSDCIPSNANNSIHILTLGISKDFVFKGIVSKHSVTYQENGNSNILPLPRLVYYNSTYYDKDIRFFTGGILKIQPGFDVYYHSAFYANAYNPALGVFYLQPSPEKKKLGNYPLVDVYLKFRVKHVGFYVKCDHINNLIYKTNTFNALHYPMSEWLIRFGLSWLFYD